MNYKRLPNENEHLEYKSNKSKLSKDIWETISSFENTDGGLIILGVNETIKNNKKAFTPAGINNSQQILDDFWSTIDNVISYSTIKNDDINCIQLEDNSTIIEIHVNEAASNKKPIYSNGSAFIRKGAVDIKAKNEDLNILLRDSRDDLDTKVLKNYSISDLNINDVDTYKNILSQRIGYESYKTYSTEEFLKKIGVLSKDYDNDGKYGLTVGGLLFFGENNPILHTFPNFQLDYFDKSNPYIRWTNRISSIEGNLNIFSFYNKVINAISSTVPEPFKLDNNLGRIDTSGSMIVALREAILNMLMHADYYGDSPIVANTYINYYEFSNPGKMKISPEDFFTTNNSKTRNPIISKLFIQMGKGERAGHGGEKIYESAINNDYRVPKIVSINNETKLTIWKVDYANSFSGEEIDERERDILKSIVSNASQELSHKQIENETNLSRSIVSRTLSSLIDKGIIIKTGNARSTKYGIIHTEEQLFAQLQAMPNILRNILKHNK